MDTDLADIVVYDDRVVVRAHGELDLLSAGGLVVALRSASTHHKDVVLDMSAVAFVDVVAMRMIVDAKTRINADGHDLAVVNPPAVLRRLARVLNAEDVIRDRT